MTTERESGNVRPWYRHFWVWFLMAPPAATVIFWAVVLSTAASPPSLVVDDYSKIGLTYQQQRGRDLAAARLDLSARFHAVRDDGVLSVVLIGAGEPPERLELLLAHPAEAARDIGVILERGAGGVYRADLRRVLDAARHLELRPVDGSWRLTGRLTAGQSEIVLLPQGNAAGS